MAFIKYEDRKPKEEKEYLCRFYGDQSGAIRGCQYLEFRDGYFQSEHADYYNLEWYEEEPVLVSEIEKYEYGYANHQGMTSNEMPVEDVLELLNEEGDNSWEVCGNYLHGFILKRKKTK